MTNATDHITHLYMVRHAETDFNRNGIVQGRGVDVPLNSLGLSQATMLAQRFDSIELDAVYSSPLVRAAQTARIIVEKKSSIPFTMLDGLEEMSWGIYEGQPRSEELTKAFKTMKREWGGGNYEFRIEQGESILDVQRRGLQALNHIVSRHPGEHVAVVAHGRFLRIILASILDQYGLPRMEEFDMQNTSFNHLIFSKGRFEAKVLQCTAHLASMDVIN